MRCLFEAKTAVRISGELVEGRFEAEFDEVVESLVSNGLIEPVLAPPEPVDVPCWELEHCEA